MGDTLGRTGDDFLSDDEQAPELDWVVVKSLMDAQANTNASLEQYLLCVTHDEFGLDGQQMGECLSQAITHHERALEDLKMARELVAEGAD